MILQNVRRKLPNISHDTFKKNRVFQACFGRLVRGFWIPFGVRWTSENVTRQEFCSMAKEKAEPAKSTKSITKNEFFTHIAEKTEMKKADVAKVYEAMTEVIVKQLSSKGPGVVALPGLFKLKAKKIPAVKGGQKVPNRFKPGEFTVTKAKPASMKVSARPLKALKEMVK